MVNDFGEAIAAFVAIRETREIAQPKQLNTINFGYKRFRYKGFSLIRDYAKGPK